MKADRCDIFLLRSVQFLSRSDKLIFAQRVRKFSHFKDPDGSGFITPATCLSSEQN